MKSTFVRSSTLLSVALLVVLSACASAPASATATPAVLPASTQTSTSAALQPLDAQRSLNVNGLERTYLIHVPAGLSADAQVPLVFVFHGLSETAGLVQNASGMDLIADASGFIVVYPNGSGPASGQSWNVGKCCGYALQNNMDETEFIRQIIADVNTLARVDSQRVYASGFSNGALLSYRLACDMADTFAAIAPVAGVLITEPCQPARPVAVIDFHGMSDTLVPYAGGGNVPDLNEPFPSVMGSVTAWAKLDGCSETPQVEEAAVYTRSIFSSCQGNSAVELYAVKGIGHSWPSQYVIPASQLIWDFFKAHPKP